jgi:superfamily II DNA/RNA helicase
MLDMDFEKKINFIIFKLHSAKKKALAEPEVPKYVLDANGEPVEEDASNTNNQLSSKRIDPQTILISATLSNGIKEIARRLNIKDPVHLDASDTVASLLKTLNQNNENQDEAKASEEEKIALPAGLSHYFMIVPSKLRLIALISFIMGKVLYQMNNKSHKLVVFAATNDSVQFHENLLNTFLNRKFNMYLDDDDNYDSDLDSSFMQKSTKNKICDLFSLYGNMDQHKRADILKQFCKATSGVLICTVCSTFIF